MEKEKRRSERIILGFKAELISNGISYTVVIENLSEDGVCVVTFPAETALDFTPGTIVELKFQPFSGETLNLHCKVKWCDKTSPHGLRSKIGMEIMDPQWEKSNYFL